MKKEKILSIIFLTIIILGFVILITPKSFQNDTLFDISLGDKLYK